MVCDSFFCSINLSNSGTFLTGTARSNRPMPASIKRPAVAPGQIIYQRQVRILKAAHKPLNRQKPVRLLSTTCKARDVKGKPQIAKVYNELMSGVDEADMVESCV